MNERGTLLKYAKKAIRIQEFVGPMGFTVIMDTGRTATTLNVVLKQLKPSLLNAGITFAGKLLTKPDLKNEDTLQAYLENAIKEAPEHAQVKQIATEAWYYLKEHEEQKFKKLNVSQN